MAPEAVSQTINGCAAHDSGQSARPEGKNGPHFKSFTTWLNMAESVQRIVVRRALSGQHPQNAQEVIDWLEQTAAGWNANPTPFVWNGKRRRRRERAKLRRLGGSGAALAHGYSIPG